MKATPLAVATSRLSVPSRCFARLILFSLGRILADQLHATPLKVFILASQSKMEGHAKVETFHYIGDEPATAPLLKQKRGADGKPRVCDGTWLSSFTGSSGGQLEN